MKEWIKASHSRSGTTVTVTVQRDNCTARWTEKASTTKGEITKATKRARVKACSMLVEIESA